MIGVAYAVDGEAEVLAGECKDPKETQGTMVYSVVAGTIALKSITVQLWCCMTMQDPVETISLTTGTP